MENWIYRAELAITRGDVGSALTTIKQISARLLGSGFHSEYIRISKKALHALVMREAIINEYPYFDEVLSDLADTLAQQGRFAEANQYILEYESCIEGKGARYINLCDIKCYQHWIQEDYKEAVRWGTTGAQLKEKTNLDTRFDCSHNLALSQRDLGLVDQALGYFLMGESLDDVLEMKVKGDRDGTFYGNIGRCLFKKGDFSNSLTCLVKSAQLLKNDESQTSIINRGWAAQWIGEILETLKRINESVIFYRMAFFHWEEAFPSRAKRINSKISEIVQANESILTRAINLDDYDIVYDFTARWLDSYKR